VGTPGDTIEIRPPGLFRNGAAIQGAAAFDKNARREAGFPGYTLAPSYSKIFTKPAGPVTVIPDGFLAMGDNSPDSADSRYWGFVPAGDVVGRPLWVYFPFTRRWGPAR
jgi:signal peptidase I